MQHAIDTLTTWLRRSRFTVVFTGAGMSTESGLPDFRSSGGLWRTGRRFEELASVTALERAYDEFVAFYRWRIDMINRHSPHEGHAVLARWQQDGIIHALITQNVDGYHQRAGSPDVIELHGTLRTVHCQQCRRGAPAETFLRDDGLNCPHCGGNMRPSVVLFGEVLPERALLEAERASRQAELFIVLGSSLVVSPANGFPQLAKARGARLVIVNRDPTPLDALADLRLTASIRDVLTAVDAKIRRT